MRAWSARNSIEIPLAQGFRTDLYAVLVEQFLHITLAERKTMVRPNGVLDDAERETVAVWPAISHGRPADFG